MIEIVGYQEEKVHTGLLAWLLASDLERESPLRRALLMALFPEGAPCDRLHVTPYREWSGNRIRVDLVLEGRVGANDGDLQWVSAIECKTDSDVQVGQLERTRASIEARYPGARHRFVILTVGAAQHTLSPRAEQEKAEFERWTALRAGHLLEILRASPDASDSAVATQWAEALGNEIVRDEKVVEAFRNPDLRAALGYRHGYSDYYRYYAHLKDHLPGTWLVNSGGRNPVLHCLSGRKRHEHADGYFETYFEFNWSRLYLKAAFWEGRTRPDSWASFVDSARAICSATAHAGEPTRRKSGGSSASIYRWHFPFDSGTPATIAAQVEAIMDQVHPRLKLS